MGRYYSNALYCILAIYAHDNSKGFIRERHAARYPWRGNKCMSHDESSYTIELPYEMTTPDLETIPLMYRKWGKREYCLPGDYTGPQPV